eukprot:TRINITY_DN15528_c0_g1::TRINITY_DN15528_c0_g1_i1::g.28454::m.28454 TRINITY_DN15528_c0_g1::TRINITY_DN15528_c0_g1_i1::g.28454  ORF type:complete len:557 (+),score=55.12,sp/Q9FIV6/DGP10_ARATH/38.43/3e-106,Trypsin_2/PF13365.1/6.1e-17,PDZ_2/PF13180.1/4.5e-07,PDZ_2/PF13180.1/7.3e+02,Trypsin/PF00089.21/3.2e-05,Peptidase_S46/PF10459.4/3.3e+02,Peptidase_S46/PF10459.4/0.47 TRINITY_DN15528_c0_g1_i1:39-1709(+)
MSMDDEYLPTADEDDEIPLDTPNLDVSGLDVDEHSRKKRKAAPPEPQSTTISDSVLPARLPLASIVKLFVKKVPPSYRSPWRKGSQHSVSGSGFILPNRGLEGLNGLILTNAHVVSYYSSIFVRRHGSSSKFPARVLCVGHGCDLAILTVDDKGFWAGHQDKGPRLHPDLPHLDDNVTCVGYPIGGNNISVTRGVVSRIDVHDYRSKAGALLTIQIDAAINPGNSGGPVFDKDSSVVGVARAHLYSASNIGYIIPIPVVNLFLQHFDSSYRGSFLKFPGVSSLCISVQPLESPSLREKLKLGTEITGGVLIRRVDKMGVLSGLVQQGDVLLQVDGHEIAEDGTVGLRGEERIYCEHLITIRPVGHSATLTIFREGEKREIQVTLAPRNHLVPILDDYDCKPSYFIFGGLVFLPLTLPYFQTAYPKSRPAPINLVRRLNEDLEEEGQQVVILAYVLAHQVNYGYHSMGGLELCTVNDMPVKNLTDFVQKVDAITDKFVVLKFEDDSIIALDKSEAIAAEQVILEQHLIRARSSGLETDQPITNTVATNSSSSSASSS